eukprot:63940-Rhodomonas_salina.1
MEFLDRQSRSGKDQGGGLDLDESVSFATKRKRHDEDDGRGGQRSRCMLPPADLKRFLEIWRTVPAEPLAGREVLKAFSHLSSLW